MKSFSLFWLVLLAVLLSACAVPPSSLTPAGPLTSPLRPTTPPAADDTVIRYERSGGIAGRVFAWTVYASGRIVDNAGVETKADPGKLAALLAIARNPKTLALTSPAGRQCPDCYAYTVRITTVGRTTTLVTYDAVANPPELDALLAALADVTR
ncbi:MAG: hypothetical protein ABIQ99_03370 [Thermoflexales bacterium]